MTSILRPFTPPLALMSSAAIDAALVSEAPATEDSSPITPILIGSLPSDREQAHSQPAIPKRTAPAIQCLTRSQPDLEVERIRFPPKCCWAEHYSQAWGSPCRTSSQLAFSLLTNFWEGRGPHLRCSLLTYVPCSTGPGPTFEALYHALAQQS